MKKLFHSSSLKAGRTPPLSPGQYVRLAAGNLELICTGRDPKTLAKAVDDLSKNMRDIKEILYGNTEKFPTPELGSQLATEIFKGEFLSQLIYAVPSMEFDTRRDTSLIVAYLQRQKLNNKIVASEYFSTHTDLLDHMIVGYENADNALFYGSMLKDCIRHQSVAQYILNCPNFPKLFTYMELPNFEVASDAATCFRELLTRHKSTVAAFLDSKFDWFFTEYRKLLLSPNYITRRMAAKMLGEILLERSNAGVLCRYISDLENLKAVMSLMRDPNLSIQVEAIHMFKAFAVSEARSPDVTKILCGNKDKLVRYFLDFKMEKEDARLEEEKTAILEAVQNLEVH